MERQSKMIKGETIAKIKEIQGTENVHAQVMIGSNSRTMFGERTKQ